MKKTVKMLLCCGFIMVCCLGFISCAQHDDKNVEANVSEDCLAEKPLRDFSLSGNLVKSEFLIDEDITLEISLGTTTTKKWLDDYFFRTGKESDYSLTFWATDNDTSLISIDTKEIYSTFSTIIDTIIEDPVSSKAVFVAKVDDFYEEKYPLINNVSTPKKITIVIPKMLFSRDEGIIILATKVFDQGGRYYEILFYKKEENSIILNDKFDLEFFKETNQSESNKDY